MGLIYKIQKVHLKLQILHNFVFIEWFSSVKLSKSKLTWLWCMIYHFAGQPHILMTTQYNILGQCKLSLQVLDFALSYNFFWFLAKKPKLPDMLCSAQCLACTSARTWWLVTIFPLDNGFHNELFISRFELWWNFGRPPWSLACEKNIFYMHARKKV